MTAKITVSAKNVTRHGSPALMCKRLLMNGSTPASESYGFSYKSRLIPFQVDDLKDLSEVIKLMQPKSTACIIRGQAIRNTSQHQRRTLNGKDATIDRETATRWLMIDIDNLTLSDCELPGVLSDYDSRTLADAAISQLPECFQGTSYLAQFSNSHNFGDDHKIKLHVFYWLDRDYTSSELSRIGRHQGWQNRYIDMATLSSANQPHYVVAPVLQGIDDPWSERVLFVRKREQAARLPLPPAKPAPTTTVLSHDSCEEERILRFLTYASHMPTAIKGDGRSRTFFRYLNELIRFDIPDSHAIHLANQYNENCCDPMFSPRDVARQFQNAKRYSEGDRGSRL